MKIQNLNGEVVEAEVNGTRILPNFYGKGKKHFMVSSCTAVTPSGVKDCLLFTNPESKVHYLELDGTMLRIPATFNVAGFELKLAA